MLKYRANTLIFKKLINLNINNVLIKPSLSQCYATKSSKKRVNNGRPLYESSIDEIYDHFLTNRKSPSEPKINDEDNNAFNFLNKKSQKNNRESEEVVINNKNNQNENENENEFEGIEQIKGKNKKSTKNQREIDEVIINKNKNNNNNNENENKNENVNENENVNDKYNDYDNEGPKEESATDFLKSHRILHQTPKSEINLKEKKLEKEQLERKRLSLNRENINFSNNANRKQIFKKKNSDRSSGILPKGLANNIIKNEWMKRQMTDPFVAMAQKNDLISRAAYKIINIDNQIKLFKEGQIVVDLGASPGGWSKYIKKCVTNNGLVVSVDTSSNFQLDKDAFIEGDFTEEEIQNKIRNLVQYKSFNGLKDLKHSLFLSEKKVEQFIDDGQFDLKLLKKKNGCGSLKKLVDVVVSDMAPQYSGVSQVDHSRLIELQKTALTFAFKVLKRGGSFVCKVSRGGEEKSFFKLLESNFISVKSMKPEASRQESTEIYYIGKNYIG
ncbi:hypothetical protein RB653_010088 [Dictyostelium firmibasis]|uniref:rRNA methyltransferase 2, mitochondrial n=1 Tax=Dictyostelium firmibasis TaxID=79012 RepID=A0AAN7YKQ2_9MYCE